ncbi:hypothetical protein B1A99_27535 [Cohnella sp. CIP 111063]|uniref:hypothetical protein n=1 Tax=unclassified Cohnella TaxID=2636738 RepID=UPI000B8C4E4A|nr:MULTISPECIES: hypothetical protein [unclassified Cohnella]OXS53991.1 hypothetical protein B1A99_27535 [Cohnella sp. CIP 111063]PRX62863.1 hypothetical protein B0G52_12216 [Cohnella sp. SGD-V74]
MDIFESLRTFSMIIPKNTSAFMDAFPKESQAAEAVHQGIATLIYKHAQVDLEDTGYSTAVTLAFGAHSAWISSFNMTVAGYIDTGWSEIRRAVEFTCYASKVVNSEKRAINWIKQRTDPDARRSFSGECQIPTAYTSDKYKFLRELLVTYDMANYYGAHGNLETMAGKYRHVKDNELIFSYQADKDIIFVAAAMMILNGYRILQSFRLILEKKLAEPKKMDELLKYIDRTIIDLRMELAKENYSNSVPQHIVRHIYTDDKEETNRMFYELLEREKKRKQRD